MMVRHRQLLVALLLLVSLVLSLPVPGRAQAYGAPVLVLEPSARASGMGRTSTAVFWGGDPNDAVNPALLGYHQGIRLTHGKTQLVPDLADDVFLKTDRITLGVWGAGLSLVGRPFEGLGRTRLDYGWSMATREDGVELGRFRSYEDLYSFGAGVNLIEFAENYMTGRLHSARPVSRYGDVSLGYATKKVDLMLAPAWATPEGIPGIGSVHTEDTGLLVRLTPINTVDGPGILSIVPELADLMQPLGGLRVDYAYGRSTQNRDRQRILFVYHDQGDPAASIDRRGWAVRGTVGLPPSVRDALAGRGLGFLADGLSPLIQVGVARDRLHDNWPYWRDPDIRHRGWEVIVANVLSLRRGHIEDKGGDIIDDTSGWGLGFQVGRFGGFRYDRATVPQARVLDHVKPEGFTVFVRPLEIRAAM